MPCLVNSSKAIPKPAGKSLTYLLPISSCATFMLWENSLHSYTTSWQNHGYRRLRPSRHSHWLFLFLSAFLVLIPLRIILCSQTLVGKKSIKERFELCLMFCFLKPVADSVFDKAFFFYLSNALKSCYFVECTKALKHSHAIRYNRWFLLINLTTNESGIS